MAAIESRGRAVERLVKPIRRSLVQPVHHRVRPQPPLSSHAGESQLDLHQLDHSPLAGGGRALSFGHLYDARGVLHVACVQEGELRLARPRARNWLAQAALSAMTKSRDVSAWLGLAAPAPSHNTAGHDES